MSCRNFVKAMYVVCMVLVSGQSVAEWKSLQTENKAISRHESGLVSHHGQLYVIGGRGTNVKATEVYDPNTNRWTTKQAPPFQMHHITPVSVGNKILIVTGFTGNYPTESPFTHVWEYEPLTDKWRRGFEIPESRRRGGAGVTSYDGKVYIVGGIKYGHTSGTTNMVDVYDPKTASWLSLTDAPHIRDHSNAAILDGKLVAFGGRNTSYHEPDKFFAFIGQVNDKIDVYDFDNDQWRTLKQRHPIPTAGAGAVVFNKRIYFTGGEHAPKAANNRTISFDLSSKAWREESTLNRGRHGTNATLIGNKMYIAAGAGNQGGGPELNSIEVLTLDK